MANRFLDTNYYKSPFVRGLKGALKSLYSFIICDCDGAGIWNLDLDAAGLYTGFTISMLEFEDNFVKTGKAMPIGGGKYFFPDFIEHQYPSGLQENNTAHKNFIKTLKKFDLVDENLIVKKNGASKGLHSLIGLCIGNGNGQGNGLGIGQLPENSEKWNTKPGKEYLELELDKTKGGAVIQLFKFSKNHTLTEIELQLLWGIFKAQNFNGEKYYASKNEAFSHFINWSKTQNVTDNGKSSTTKKTNGSSYKTAGQEAYAERLQQQLIGLTGG